MKLFDRVLNPREIRRRLGLNQEQFWTQIGVTQSGGSRYESGREMPKPVRELLRLVHVEQVDLSQVKRVDFEIINYLKTSHADLYRTLRKAVKGKESASPPAPELSDMDAGDTISSRPTLTRSRATVPPDRPRRFTVVASFAAEPAFRRVSVFGSTLESRSLMFVWRDATTRSTGCSTQWINTRGSSLRTSADGRRR
jgi:transcriptional regulator with XRE-family HTH domain